MTSVYGCREFVLAALLAHCDDTSHVVTCLDAFAATGKLYINVAPSISKWN